MDRYNYVLINDGLAILEANTIDSDSNKRSQSTKMTIISHLTELPLPNKNLASVNQYRWNMANPIKPRFGTKQN